VKAPLQTSSGLLDIEPPVIPADSAFAITILVMALVITLTICSIFAIRHYTSCRSKARRRLRQLYSFVSDSTDESPNYREISYQLAQILASGTGQNGITGSTVLPVVLMHHHQRWQDFTCTLSSARYSTHSCHRSSLDAMFKESFFWLKHWP